METLLIIAKSVGILSLFYIIYITLLQQNTFFTANRHYFLAGILAAIVIPFIEFTKKTTVLIPSQPQSISPMYYENISPAEKIPIVLENPFIVNWWQVLFVIYSIGVLIMLCRFVIQLHSLKKLISFGTPVQENDFTLITVQQDISPFSFFSSIVFNPNLHTQEELMMILEHEKVHASQNHSIDILLINVILVLQWFNPIIWLYKRSLEQNLEYIADATAIKNSQNSQEYQRTLVKVSSPKFIPALTNQFYQSFIKKRIVMLNTPQSHKRNLWKLGIILPLLAFFMYSFNVKEVIDYVEEENPAFAKTFNVSSSPNSINTLGSSTTEKDHGLTAESSSTPKNVVPTDEININPALTNQTLDTDQKDMTSKNATDSETNNDAFETIQETYRFTITKSTTLEQLKSLKETLKNNHRAQLEYSNVDYNENNEIINIQLAFTDANGNNKSYVVQGKTPIADIYIYRDANGQTGLSNSGASDDSVSRLNYLRGQSRREEMTQNRDSMMQKLDARREEMQRRMELRREEMQVRGEVMRNRRDSLRQLMSYRKDSLQRFQSSSRDSLRGQIISIRKDSMRSNRAKYLQDKRRIKSENGTSYYIHKNDGTTSFYNMRGEKVEERVSSSGVKETAIQFSKSGSNTAEKPLIYIDNKRSTEEAMNHLPAEQIENMSVLKGKAAIKLYGKKAKNGVIVIETKE